MSAPPTLSDVWLTFAGIIDNQACARLFERIAWAVQSNATRIHLLIQSAGGVVGDGVAMHNTLAWLPVEVITYNVGAAESVAVLPYLAGKTRKVSKTATFMIHKTAFPMTAVRATSDELRAKASESDIHDNNVEAILRRFLKMPDDRWATHSARDLVISAEDALAFGIAHELGEFAPMPGAPLVNI